MNKYLGTEEEDTLKPKFISTIIEGFFIVGLCAVRPSVTPVGTRDGWPRRT
jgi:hypothetical protein